MTTLENVHAFTAMRGVQGGRDYYVAMCPLKVISKLFLFDEAELPAELRAQRVLNRGRIPEISRYLVDNYRDYILSSLTASVDGKVVFEPFGGAGSPCNVGRLLLPMSARFVINDGQHRRAAIEQALKERPDLGEETLSVVIFVDAGLKRSQQMFADLNRHSVRPTTSLSILYDQRDPLAQITCRLVSRVSVFKPLTEMERTSLPRRSAKLYCLSNIYQATLALFGKAKRRSIPQEQELLGCAFWEEVARHIPEWHLAAEGKVSCEDLRKDYVHAHGVALQALGLAGAGLLAQEPQGWKAKMKGLRKIDWRRSNAADWEGRALLGGRVSKAHFHVLLTSNLLKQKLGVSLGSAEKEAEGQLGRLRNAAS
jgi:DNA sulfur modification protein DndB